MYRWLVLLSLVGCAGSSHAPAPVAEVPDADGPPLWMQVSGAGDPTVVFEAGGGDDSSVWAAIEPAVRLRAGVRTVVYDRAGLGKSAPMPGPYRIDHEVAALERGLARFSIKGPVVLVAHSYGGFVAELMAATDPRIAGVVLVDANLPEAFDAAELAHIQAKYATQLPALAQAHPALARVMRPVIEAYPETVRRLKAAAYPAALPTIDIVAEHSWGDSDAENAALARAHAAFVAGSPAREAVLAAGSSHDVMHDQPDVVIQAVARLLQRLHAGG